MFEYLKHHVQKSGMPPGALQYFGENKAGSSVLNMYAYSAQTLQVTKPPSFAACREAMAEDDVAWINLDGAHDADLVREAGEVFGLHPLLLEDILHTSQRPRLDDSGPVLFLTLRMLRIDKETGRIRDEQICLALGANYVLSFQEVPGDVFDGVRQRIANRRSRIRQMGADYLFYCLLDAIVDHYFVVLERMSESIEDIEENLLESPDQFLSEQLHLLRREGLFVRKAIWPVHEIVTRLSKMETELLGEDFRTYLKDVQDHVNQMRDTLDAFRYMLSSLADLHLSKVSLKMNEIMKVLTVISTFFIPLSFVAGVYGMNFKNMPELEWRWGYFSVLGVMGAMAGTMWLYFKRKKLL